MQFALETYCIMLRAFMIMDNFLINTADITSTFLLNRRNPKCTKAKALIFRLVIYQHLKMYQLFVSREFQTV